MASGMTEMVVESGAGSGALGQDRAAAVDQGGAEAAAAEIAGKDDVHLLHG